jgi:glucokinase
VLGGGVMEATEEYLMPIVKKYLPLFTWPAMLSEVSVCASALGDDAILYGAKALVLENR